MLTLLTKGGGAVNQLLIITDKWGVQTPPQIWLIKFVNSPSGKIHPFSKIPLTFVPMHRL